MPLKDVKQLARTHQIGGLAGEGIDKHGNHLDPRPCGRHSCESIGRVSERQPGKYFSCVSGTVRCLDAGENAEQDKCCLISKLGLAWRRVVRAGRKATPESSSFSNDVARILSDLLLSQYLLKPF